LYNLDEDLAEQHDLSRVMPEKLKELAMLMTRELQSRKAPMPTFKNSGKQIPWPAELIPQN